jgi:hypothetical protein
VGGIANLALRRVRLLTILALVCVPWVIFANDPSWRSTGIALAVVVALACGWAGVRFWLLRRSGTRKET